MIKTVGYAAQDATAPLDAVRFERRDPGKNDVPIEILHCGVRRSDLHTVRNEWKGATYPVMPGHEIDGRVSQVGSGAKGFRRGDLAAVGCMVVGVPPLPHPSPNVGSLIYRRRQLAGSLIGGIREIQEMLDFCGEHGIVSDIERIPIQKINEAYGRTLRSDVKYRFVIDMASLPKEE